MTPCPLCKSTDTEVLREHDSSTGKTSLLNFCKACGVCCPPSTWMQYQALEATPLCLEAAYKSVQDAHLRKYIEEQEATPSKDAGEDWMLKDSHAVHMNMLLGHLAKLTPAQVAHLYSDAECAEIVSEIQRQRPEAIPSQEAKLREFVGSIVNALGPYPDLNGHPIIADAYQALSAQPAEKDKTGEVCPGCGATEVEANTPRTVYACGGSTYDNRPGTFTACAHSAGMDPHLMTFCRAMQAQLDKNADRGDWKEGMTGQWFTDGVRRNMQDMRNELSTSEQRSRACVDLANFALMFCAAFNKPTALSPAPSKVEL